MNKTRKVAGPATQGRMGELHSKLCDILIEMVDGEVGVDVDPETGEQFEVKLDPSPQTLNVARAFLKDNDIKASIEENEDMNSLRTRLLAKQKEAKRRRFADNVVSIAGNGG